MREALAPDKTASATGDSDRRYGRSRACTVLPCYYGICPSIIDSEENEVGNVLRGKYFHSSNNNAAGEYPLLDWQLVEPELPIPRKKQENKFKKQSGNILRYGGVTRFYVLRFYLLL